MTDNTVIDPFADPRFFELTAFGVPVRLILGGQERDALAERLAHTWARCEIREVPADTSGDAEGASEFTGPVLHVAVDPDEAVHEYVWSLKGLAAETVEIVESTLTSVLTASAIEHERGQLLMVHAAGLADTATGKTVMLVGPSGTGKTTLSRVLGQEFGYVTDETLAITPDHAVRSYPKPLSLFPEGREFGKEQHSPDDLGLTPAPEQLTLAAAVILDRQPAGFQPPVLSEVPLLEAIALIAEQTSYFAHLDKPLHQLADAIQSVGGAVRITYSEAEDVVPLVRELLAGPIVPAPDAPPAAILPLNEIGFSAQPFGHTIARTELLDLLLHESGAVALTQDGRALVINPLAARILTLIGDTPTTLPPVAEALAAEFGEPESDLDQAALRLADDVVADLIGAGLLHHDG